MDQYDVALRLILNSAIRALVAEAGLSSPQAAQRLEVSLRRLWPQTLLEKAQAAGFVYDGQAWKRA